VQELRQSRPQLDAIGGRPGGYWIAQRRAHEIPAQPLRRIGQKPRRQQQRHARIELTEGREHAVGAAGGCAKHEGHRQAQCHRNRQVERNYRSSAPTEHQLSVGAKVDDAGTQRHRSGECHTNQWHGTCHGLEHLRAFDGPLQPCGEHDLWVDADTKCDARAGGESQE